MEKQLNQKRNNENQNDDKLTIQSLREQIQKKDKEITELKKSTENVNKTKFISMDQMTCIYFTSSDQKVHLPIPCIKSDRFAEIEEKLYLEYPEYRETNNIFLVNGKEVLRFKTVEENKINNYQPVMLIVPANDNN